MGYASVLPPGLGTYPSIETSRPLRWSAFEECGVRQVDHHIGPHYLENIRIVAVAFDSKAVHR